MKKATLFILLIIAMIALAGCQVANQPNVPDWNFSNLTEETGEEPEQEETTPPAEEEMEIPENAIVIEATEGEIVELSPKAVDPDGDTVYYTFTEPFNENGRWQTREGDAGQYLVTITASDGKDQTSQDIVVIVYKGNKAPVIECPEEIVVKEGETIRLDCNIYDPEGESVIVEYSGFMKSSTYKTSYEDAGEYTVQIKASDKQKTSTETLSITVLDVNRAPVISNVPETITVMETEIVNIDPKIQDPDGDELEVSYSKPFNDNGVWRTDIGDAGTHTASIIVSDGESTVKKEFEVVITQKNTAPVIEEINDITVYEGETIEIPLDARDREGDQLEVTVKGWMNSLTYTTGYEDAGEYTVTVVVSDGEFEAKQTFKVTVIDRNRPPIFKVPA